MTFKTLALASTSFVLSASLFAQATPGPGMGQGLYEQQGANSCLYCHGVEGYNGKVAASANLSQPKTWKGYKGLGGDAAYKKNPEEFVKKLKEKTLALIINGAAIHNGQLKDKYPNFDIKAAGGTYNAQMLGLAGSPSVAWLKKYKDRGVTKEIAAEASWIYMATKLDKQGILKP
jgi:hypothetical protein